MDTSVRLGWVVSGLLMLGIINYLLILGGNYGSYPLAVVSYAIPFTLAGGYLCWLLRNYPRPVFFIASVFLVFYPVTVLVNLGVLGNWYLQLGAFLGLLFVANIAIK